MPDSKSKYRFLFIQPFQLPKGGELADKYHAPGLSKERLLRMERLKLDHLLEDVEWDIHGGPVAPYGDWAVETREEFAHVAAARLPIVRKACESGGYNAIIAGQKVLHHGFHRGAQHVLLRAGGEAPRHPALRLDPQYQLLPWPARPGGRQHH